MVRDYKRKTEDRWSKERLLEVLTAIKEEKMGFEEASRTSGISRATLYRHYAKLSRNGEEWNVAQLGGEGARTLLSKYEERVLEQTILRMRADGRRVQKKEIKKICFEYCEERGIPNKFNKEKRMAGDDWYYGFLKRHPGIREVKPNTERKKVTGKNGRDQTGNGAGGTGTLSGPCPRAGTSRARQLDAASVTSRGRALGRSCRKPSRADSKDKSWTTKSGGVVGGGEGEGVKTPLKRKRSEGTRMNGGDESRDADENEGILSSNDGNGKDNASGKNGRGETRNSAEWERLLAAVAPKAELVRALAASKDNSELIQEEQVLRIPTGTDGGEGTETQGRVVGRSDRKLPQVNVQCLASATSSGEINAGDGDTQRNGDEGAVENDGDQM